MTSFAVASLGTALERKEYSEVLLLAGPTLEGPCSVNSIGSECSSPPWLTRGSSCVLFVTMSAPRSPTTAMAKDSNVNPRHAQPPARKPSSVANDWTSRIGESVMVVALLLEDWWVLVYF